MRRILIFSLTYYPADIGGAEVAVKEITDRISSEEIVFDMVTLGDGRGVSRETIGNVNIHRISKRTGIIQKFLFPLTAARTAARLHAQNHYDVIWSIMASYAGYAGYLFKKSHADVTFLLTIQEGDHFGRRILLKFLFRKIFGAADRIQAISRFLADWARTMGAKCQIEIIPNGVDVELFSKRITMGEMMILEKELGKKERDVFLITTSRLVHKNAVGDVIASLNFLPENVKFLILGTGPLKWKLKAQAAKVSGVDRVRFLEFIPHAEMPKYLQASDIFVRPSLSEGLGNSFLEAMAAGIPVIGTPVGGIPDYLTDGETGLFCEVHNPRSIAQKVEKLIKDFESREYIIKHAQEMVVKNYHWKMIAEKMAKLML